MEFEIPLALGACLLSLALLFRSVFSATRIAIVVFLFYLTPLVLNVVLPYTYAYPCTISIALLAVVLSASILASTSIGFGKPETNIRLLQLSPFVLAVASLSVACFLLEFAINPQIRNASDMEVRRDYISEGSALYRLGTALSGCSLYCLVGAVFSRSVRTFVLYATPWAAYAACSLFTGNRQFFFMGVIIVVLGILYRTNSIRRAFLVCIVPLGLAAVLLFVVQFTRGSRTAGRQDQFMMSLFHLTFKRPSLLEQSYTLNSIGTTLYVYYGTQYNVLSCIVNEDLYDNYALAATFPMIYRRMVGPFGLRNAETLRMERLDRNEAALGFFPRSWGTMYSNFYSEFGMRSLICYTVSLAIFGYLISYWQSRRPFGYIGLITWFAIIAFGINFFVFIENFSYSLIVFSLFQIGARPIPGDFERKDVS